MRFSSTNAQSFKAVLWILIPRIRLILPDPGTRSLSTDPDPDLNPYKLKIEKMGKKLLAKFINVFQKELNIYSLRLLRVTES